MANRERRILIVESEEARAAHLADYLSNNGYFVSAAVSCGREAVEIATNACPDLALVDINLGGDRDGPDVGKHLAGRFDVPVLYLTDVINGDLLERARATGPFGYLLRPFDLRQLHLNIQAAFHARGRESRLRYTTKRLKRIIGKYRDLTRLMKTVFNSMSEGVIAVDENRVPLFNNSSAQRIGGAYSLEKDIDKWAEKYGIFQSDGETPLNEDESPLALAVNGIATDGVEVFIRNEERPDGVHVSVSGRPLLGKAGVFKGGVIVGRDVTRLKRAEAELGLAVAKHRNQARLMDAVFNSMDEGVVAIDENCRIVFSNSSARRIGGDLQMEADIWKWAEIYGVFLPDGETPFPFEASPVASALKGKATDEVDALIRNEFKPEGVHIRIRSRPLLGDGGISRGAVLVFRDVTESVAAEQAIERAFDQGRLEMVDTILHNIGNAMNSVTTGIETVRRNLLANRAGRRLSALAKAIRTHRNDWVAYINSDPQGQKALPFVIELAEDFDRLNNYLMTTVGRVSDQANHIADIIRTQKAIDCSDMDCKDIDLYEALSGAFRVLRESLNRRGIRTDVDCGNAPHEINVRESQFHQMLVNLVKNAIEAIDDLGIKGAKRGTPQIQISARIERDELVIEVIDTGIGIDAKDTGKLFMPGYTTKDSGTGLGLHSAANFVIACGGRIEPLSEGAGNGATIRVTLPLSTVAPHAITT